MSPLRVSRLLCLLVIIAGLVISCSSAPKPSVEPLRPTYLDAVKPLQVSKAGLPEATLERFYARGWVQNTDTYLNVCTVSQINKKEQYWITAAHCVVDIGEEGRFVDGLKVGLVDVQKEMDLAVIRVPGLIAKEELRLTGTPASWNTPIIIVGHPFGYPDPFVTRGYVANPLATLSSGYRFMIFDVAGAPGNSGSPVLNRDGELVSILQIGWGQSFSPVTGGAYFENLKTLEQYFTKRVFGMG